MVNSYHSHLTLQKKMKTLYRPLLHFVIAKDFYPKDYSLMVLHKLLNQSLHHTIQLILVG